MGWIRVVIVKLIALAILAGGLLGMRANEFTRMFFQNASYTFSTAKPETIDAMFDEASEVNYREYDDMITRKQSNNADTLMVVIQADSWNKISNDERAFRTRLEKAARTRNLTINGTTISGGSRKPEFFQTRRMVFIALSAVSALGIAMLVLSFRVFGGGRREEVPDLGTLDSQPAK